MKGFLTHFRLTLRLNFRNKQALIFGYFVPVFFLIVFGSFYRSLNPETMAQVLVISTLGGACFGLPVSIVSERERGVWRRYRLAPVSRAALIASLMLARFLIVLSSALLQVVLARVFYKLPAPAHPLQLLAAFVFVSFALLGMGLLIASVARTALAVQAMGQLIFLPMLLIGGVAVAIKTLPVWAQHVSMFLPGRYAVEALHVCIVSGDGLFTWPEKIKKQEVLTTSPPPVFLLLALLLIGSAACFAGSKLFRWEAEQRLARSAKWWVLLALLAWAAVGLSVEYWHWSAK